MWTSNDMRHELREIARGAIEDEIARRILIVDKSVEAALEVLGLERLDDMVGADLTIKQLAFFQNLIEERVMLADVGQEAHDACREIARRY